AADVTRGRAGPDGPNLLALAPAEREVVARGLDPDPEKRYGSCAEFVRALRAAGAEGLADTLRHEPAQTPPPAPPTPPDLIGPAPPRRPDRPALEGGQGAVGAGRLPRGGGAGRRRGGRRGRGRVALRGHPAARQLRPQVRRLPPAVERPPGRGGRGVGAVQDR